MNVCIRCNVNQTTSVYCAECKVQRNAERATQNAPIWEARRAAELADRERQRAAWDRMIGTNA